MTYAVWSVYDYAWRTASSTANSVNNWTNYLSPAGRHDGYRYMSPHGNLRVVIFRVSANAVSDGSGCSTVVVDQSVTPTAILTP